MIFDYYTVGIAAIGDASKMHIRRIVSEGHMRTILLKTDLTLLAVTIRVNHAADCSNIAGPKLGDCRSNLSDTANDLMSRNTWIDSRRRAPLATDGVEVRVALPQKRISI